VIKFHMDEGQVTGSLEVREKTPPAPTEPVREAPSPGEAQSSNVSEAPATSGQEVPAHPGQ